jgi:hypothetical protein
METLVLRVLGRISKELPRKLKDLKAKFEEAISKLL